MSFAQTGLLLRWVQASVVLKQSIVQSRIAQQLDALLSCVPTETFLPYHLEDVVPMDSSVLEKTVLVQVVQYSIVLMDHLLQYLLESVVLTRNFVLITTSVEILSALMSSALMGTLLLSQKGDVALSVNSAQ